MKNNNAIYLFKEISNKYTIQKIANILGLHKGTVLRWTQKEEVPNNYRADFLRILGVKSNKESSVKEKDQYYTKKEVAEKCLIKFKEVSSNLNIDLDDYFFY